MKASRSFETSVPTHPVTQHHISEGLNPQLDNDGQDFREIWYWKTYLFFYNYSTLKYCHLGFDAV